MAFEELKQRQSAMWGNGPYQRITETIADIHEAVVESLAPEAGRPMARPRLRNRSRRRTGRGRGCPGHGARPRARPDRDREGASGRARPGDRLRRRRRRTARVRRRVLRQGLLHLRDHVRARPRGVGARARPRDAPGGRIALANWTPRAASRRCSRSWRPTSRRRRRAARSTGATRPRPGAPGRGVRPRARGARLDAARPSGEAYWELFSTSYGPTKTLATRSATAARTCTATGSSSSRRTTGRTARSRTRASTCSCSGRAAGAAEGSAELARDDVARQLGPALVQLGPAGLRAASVARAPLGKSSLEVG